MVTAPECLATVSPLPGNCHSRIQPKQSGSPRKHSQFTERAQRTSLLSAERLAGAVTASLMTIKEELPRGVSFCLDFSHAVSFGYLSAGTPWQPSSAALHVYGHQSSTKQGKLQGSVYPTSIPIATGRWAQLLCCVSFSFHHKIGS